MLQLNSHIVLKLLDFFYMHEKAEFYLNDIVRRLGLDKRNLVKKLNELEKEGLLKSRREGNLKYYSLNRDFPLYNEYRKIVSKTIEERKSRED